MQLKQAGRQSSSCNLLVREFFIYHFPGFVKIFRIAIFSKSLSRTVPKIIKLGKNSFWQGIVPAMNMILPCKQKEVVP